MNVVAPIAAIRDGVGALLRIAPGADPSQFQLGIVGTVWCVSLPGSFVTAHHVLNDGAARVAAHRFYVLFASGNGQKLFFWPVTSFALEDSTRDLVIFEAPVPDGVNMSTIPVTLSAPPDGTPVVTYGCPAPIVASGNVTPQGALVGIQTVLFTHANVGIVSAQYAASPLTDTLFEFSVGWHHGESGGPVLQLEPSLAAIAVMQHYRNIQGPQGQHMAGPRRGLALSAIQAALRQAGATII